MSLRNKRIQSAFSSPISWYFLSSISSRPALDTKQPPVYSLPELNLAELKFKHSLPSNSEVKNEWNLTSAPPIAFMAWTGNILLFIFFFAHQNWKDSEEEKYTISGVSKRDFLCHYYVQTFPLLPEKKLKSLKHLTRRQLYLVTKVQSGVYSYLYEQRC